MTINTLSEAFGLSDDGTLAGAGPSLRRENAMKNPAQRARLVEAKQVYDRAMRGDNHARLAVNEALTTSDLFRDAIGQIMDIEMLGQYQTAEKQWTKFAKQTSVRNFKPKTLRALVGTNYALPAVPEHTPYPVAKGLDRKDQSIKVGKRGERYGYTFEARQNDDLNELQEVPGQWADVCNRTEDDAAISVLANPLTGAPNTAVFNAGNGNLGTGALTADNLQVAWVSLTTKRDASGRLMTPPALQLIVGPALQFTAQRLIGAQWIRYTDANGKEVQEANPFAGTTLTVLANLPGTAWFLLPVVTAVRPAFYVAFLTGYETPDLRQKNDAGQSLGGGQLSGDAGSFDEDTIWFRVRHIVGAAGGDPTFTYASDGSGS